MARRRVTVFSSGTALLVSMLVCLCGGCASKPPMISKPVQNTWVIDAPMEPLWKATIEALVDKGAQIKILDQETGLIVIEEFLDRSTFDTYSAEPYGFYGGQVQTNILFKL